MSLRYCWRRCIAEGIWAKIKIPDCQSRNLYTGSTLSLYKFIHSGLEGPGDFWPAPKEVVGGKDESLWVVREAPWWWWYCFLTAEVPRSFPLLNVDVSWLVFGSQAASLGIQRGSQRMRTTWIRSCMEAVILWSGATKDSRVPLQYNEHLPVGDQICKGIDSHYEATCRYQFMMYKEIPWASLYLKLQSRQGRENDPLFRDVEIRERLTGPESHSYYVEGLDLLDARLPPYLTPLEKRNSLAIPSHSQQKRVWAHSKGVCVFSSATYRDHYSKRCFLYIRNGKERSKKWD